MLRDTLQTQPRRCEVKQFALTLLRDRILRRNVYDVRKKLRSGPNGRRATWLFTGSDQKTSSASGNRIGIAPPVARIIREVAQ